MKQRKLIASNREPSTITGFLLRHLRQHVHGIRESVKLQGQVDFD